MGETPLVLFDAITVRLGRSDVVRDASIAIGAGDVIGLSGPNGSGKSTFLRTVATLLRPSSGTGTVLGAVLGSAQVVAVRPQIGLLAHEPALYGDLTLLENLELVARLTENDVGRARELLDGVGLGGAAHRRVSNSSHGMCRRVDIARLFLTEPKLLLLDEAHAGLDEAATSLIANLIERTMIRGGAAIVVSHDAAFLNRTASLRWCISDGTLEPLS